MKKENIYFISFIVTLFIISVQNFATEDVSSQKNIHPQSHISSTENITTTQNKTLTTNSQITVYVNGMVCSFCAQGVKKSFQNHKSVQSANVSLEKKSVELILEEDKSITDIQIIEIINDAGYNIEEIAR